MCVTGSFIWLILIIYCISPAIYPLCPCPLQIVATAYAVHIKQLAAKVKPRMDFGLQCTYIYFLCTYATCTHLCKFGSSWLFTETAVCFIERVRLLQSSFVNSLPFCQEIHLICVSAQEEALLFKSPLSISFNERLSVVVMLLSFYVSIKLIITKSRQKSIITLTL